MSADRKTQAGQRKPNCDHWSPTREDRDTEKEKDEENRRKAFSRNTPKPTNRGNPPVKSERDIPIKEERGDKSRKRKHEDKSQDPRTKKPKFEINTELSADGFLNLLRPHLVENKNKNSRGKLANITRAKTYKELCRHYYYVHNTECDIDDVINIILPKLYELNPVIFKSIFEKLISIQNDTLISELLNLYLKLSVENINENNFLWTEKILEMTLGFPRDRNKLFTGVLNKIHIELQDSIDEGNPITNLKIIKQTKKILEMTIKNKFYSGAHFDLTLKICILLNDFETAQWTYQQASNVDRLTMDILINFMHLGNLADKPLEVINAFDNFPDNAKATNRHDDVKVSIGIACVTYMKACKFYLSDNYQSTDDPEKSSRSSVIEKAKQCFEKYCHWDMDIPINLKIEIAQEYFELCKNNKCYPHLDDAFDFAVKHDCTESFVSTYLSIRRAQPEEFKTSKTKSSYAADKLVEKRFFTEENATDLIHWAMNEKDSDAIFHVWNLCKKYIAPISPAFTKLCIETLYTLRPQNWAKRINEIGEYIFKERSNYMPLYISILIIAINENDTQLMTKIQTQFSKLHSKDPTIVPVELKNLAKENVTSIRPDASTKMKNFLEKRKEKYMIALNQQAAPEDHIQKKIPLTPTIFELLAPTFQGTFSSAPTEHTPDSFFPGEEQWQAIDNYLTQMGVSTVELDIALKKLIYFILQNNQEEAESQLKYCLEVKIDLNNFIYPRKNLPPHEFHLARSLFTLASEYGMNKLVKILLNEKKFDPNITPCLGAPRALQLSFIKNHDGTTMTLLKGGAQPDRYPNVDANPMRRAIETGNLELLKACELSYKNCYGDNVWNSFLPDLSCFITDSTPVKIYQYIENQKQAISQIPPFNNMMMQSLYLQQNLPPLSSGVHAPQNSAHYAIVPPSTIISTPVNASSPALASSSRTTTTPTIGPLLMPGIGFYKIPSPTHPAKSPTTTMSTPSPGSVENSNENIADSESTNTIPDRLPALKDIQNGDVLTKAFINTNDDTCKLYIKTKGVGEEKVPRSYYYTVEQVCIALARKNQNKESVELKKYFKFKRQHFNELTTKDNETGENYITPKLLNLEEWNPQRDNDIVLPFLYACLKKDKSKIKEYLTKATQYQNRQQTATAQRKGR